MIEDKVKGTELPDELKVLLSFDSHKALFKVSRANGIKNGLTEFFDDKGRIEASYSYVEDQCDYLESVGFEPGSMGELRQKDIRKQNRKHKLSNPTQMKRFYSMELGFYSLEQLYALKLAELTVSVERLESIERKMKSIPNVDSRIGRWCKSSICACLGCANHIIGWSNEEYLSYMLYARAKSHGVQIHVVAS
ncbi:hypothetical protein LMH73_026390 [Vibrio splendidus]|nr:hypothetical protein [Vibrio splendidus]MCC4880872.1 hypothetical protein [Vibrio splendidus]